MELDSTELALGSKQADIKEDADSCSLLELELKSARAAIGRDERVLQDFVE